MQWVCFVSVTVLEILACILTGKKSKKKKSLISIFGAPTKFPTHYKGGEQQKQWTLV